MFEQVDVEVAQGVNHASPRITVVGRPSLTSAASCSTISRSRRMIEWTQSSSSNIALPRSVSDPPASVSWVSATAVNSSRDDEGDPPPPASRHAGSWTPGVALTVRGHHRGPAEPPALPHLLWIRVGACRKRLPPRRLEQDMVAQDRRGMVPTRKPISCACGRSCRRRCSWETRCTCSDAAPTAGYPVRDLSTSARLSLVDRPAHSNDPHPTTNPATSARIAHSPPWGARTSSTSAPSW